MLILPDDAVEFVEGDINEGELMARFGLDELVEDPRLDVVSGVCLDGPLEDEVQPYVTNRLGEYCRVWLPPRPGGPIHVYVVSAVGGEGRLAQLRFVGTE